MNTLKYLKTISLLGLAFLSSCSSFQVSNPSDSYESVKDNTIYPMSTASAIKEIELTIELMEKDMEVMERNIDNSDWIMSYFNFLAARDIYLIEEIHSNLKYSTWTVDQKKEFLNYFLSPHDGFLSLMRADMLEELQYLVKYSEILRDIPWLLRSRFNEKSEFSYWYVIYIGKSIDPVWVENMILPVMLDLIPLDEITPVSYLWLKNPDSLGNMDKEILFSGYPWTSLLHIIRINQEIIVLIQDLYKDDENGAGSISESVLI